MAYLAPIHRPSSVRHAIKLNLLSKDSECLILAKANRLEIWSLSAEGGLVMLQSKAIYGRISMLAKIRPQGAKLDHLFVGTQRFQYFALAWDAEAQSLYTVKSFVDVSEKHMRDSQSRDRCLVDPTGSHLMLELFEGVLSFVKMNRPRRGGAAGEYMDPSEQVRISELRVRSTCFLYTETNRPKLAILYDTGLNGDVRLATYRIVDDKAQYSSFDHTKDRENEVDDLCVGASHLIPVPKGESERRYIVRNASVVRAQVGGVIVVGETKMTYLDDESRAVVGYALDEASIFVAWERYDDLRYFLADDYGNLHLLSLVTDVNGFVTGMDLKRLGTTTKATVMVHLGRGLLFIASHEGDLELVQVDVEELSVELLQTMANIAPILDFAVMDLGGRDGESQSNEYSSGQARLVTGSGAYEKGSLRSVRSGVGLEDVGILADMEDIQAVFSLRSSERAIANDTVVVSLPTETRVLTFNPEGDIEEVESFRGLTLDQQTLLAVNLPGDYLLQITTSCVIILGAGPSFIVARWKPPAGQTITAASANAVHVLLSANGNNLVTLDIQNMLQEIAVRGLEENDEVACVHVPTSTTPIGIVGFWKSGSISVLNLTDLSIIHSEDLRRISSNASVPRDIAMTQILPETISGPTLFVAMEDGIVLSFVVDKHTSALSGRKSVVLGTQQARFEILARKDGLFNVFATCEHPSLIYGAEGRIVYSAVTAENATCVCTFDSEAYPDSIILATSSHLKISQIDTERRTHVRTLPMGKTIRRIAYSSKERAFGIGSIRRELIDAEEVVESSFELVEDVLFNQIGKPFILQDSNGQELVECVTRASLPSSHSDGQLVERFLVGTSYLTDTATAQNAGGRLLVFGIDSNRTPFLVCSHIIKGACRQVAMLDGKIVASLVKTVVVYSYLETSTSSATLSKLATYRTSTCPIDISITGDIIAVADLMKSVSLIQYIPGSQGTEDQLVEIARHHQSCWATAVVSLGGGEWFESDQEGNLILLKRNVEGLTETDRRRLEVIAEANLGEMVNCIRKIDVEASSGAMIVPKAFLGTTEGSIYLLSTILPESFTFLSTLQALLATTPNGCRSNSAFSGLHTLGDLGFNTYRAFKNQERETAEPFRFIDGELIERFLDLNEKEQEALLKGTGWDAEEVRGRVEGLRKGH